MPATTPCAVARSKPGERRRRSAAQTTAISIRLRERENGTRRGRLCVALPVDVGDDGLRDSYAAADMNCLALGPHGATSSFNDRMRLTLSSSVVYPVPFGSVEWIAHPRAACRSSRRARRRADCSGGLESFAVCPSPSATLHSEPGKFGGNLRASVGRAGLCTSKIT